MRDGWPIGLRPTPAQSGPSVFNKRACAGEEAAAFSRFAPLAAALGQSLDVRSTIIDGEVMCLDARGRPQFNDLLFARGELTFVAFDVRAVNGRDLRGCRSPSASDDCAFFTWVPDASCLPSCARMTLRESWRRRPTHPTR
jgi:hypothetical protein